MKVRTKAIVRLTPLLLGAVILTGCSSSSSLGGASSSSGSASTDTATSITVGSANFSENVILADIYGQALEAEGFDVHYKLNIGARAAYIAALKKGEIDLVPEYSGSLLDFLEDKATATTPEDVTAALDKALPSNLVALTEASAADSDSLNVTPATAAKYDLHSIADLSSLGSFSLGANPEFSSSPAGIKGLAEIYGIKNVKFKSIADGGGPTTLKALLDGSIQVADIYSTTPSILDNGLVTLQDPKGLFASQEVVPVLLKSKASTEVKAVLDKVSAVLTTKDLLELNKLVSGDAKEDPAVAAKGWLTSAGLL